MKKVIILNKIEGETPLEALERFRASHQKYKDISMTYAGRLDPMASGVLVILAGEEVHRKEKYLGLPKEYDFQILFGFSTDTYDILGKIKKRFRGNELLDKSSIEKKIEDNIKYFRGKFIQKYPVYSSRTVNGKPLFEYARSGMKLKAPAKEIFVRSLKLEKIKIIKAKNLLSNIQKRISRVSGDFRQKEILNIWEDALVGGDTKFFLADFNIKCGSGTYVRGIVNDLGKKIGIPATTFSIKRTKVGKYT